MSRAFNTGSAEHATELLQVVPDLVVASIDKGAYAYTVNVGSAHS